jgi:hypothetical protein
VSISDLMEAQMRLAVAAVLTAMLYAPPTDARRARTVESITYTVPGGGLFPTAGYAVTVSSDGTGLFTGRVKTVVKGERRFAITKSTFAAFKALLAPYRPAGDLHFDGEPLCKEMATDQGSVDVAWSGGGRPGHLFIYYGCDMEKNRAMFDAVAGAPKLLPIKRFISRR